MKSLFLCTSIFFTLILVGCNPSDTKKSQASKPDHIPVDSVVISPPILKYGFNISSYNIKEDTVQESQTMSHVMLPHGISQVQCNEAYIKAKDSLIGLNYIVPGHPYMAIYDKQDSSKALHFIYEKNKVDYIVFSFMADSVHVQKKQKPVKTLKKSVSGQIKSSLWNAFMSAGLSPELLMTVVNTYQWSVDFFTVQPGDYFKLIYNERSVEGTLVNAGKIHAIEINTYDSSYYAIPFESGDSVKGFFDGNGGSLRKALLKAPLDYIRVSSKFSKSRKHPVLGIYRPHYGVDYAAPFGTPVVSVGDGTVTYAGYSRGAGNLIKIKHNEKILTMYMHLQKMNVRAGDHVIQGQLIGEVGSTGLSTGPHLDYRIKIGEKYVDPLSANIPTSDPLDQSLLNDFMIYRDSLVNQLTHIDIPSLDTLN